MRADARGFWPFRGLNALFGRKFVNFPIAYCSDIAYRSVGADVGIGPYKHVQNPVRADRVVRPYKDLQKNAKTQIFCTTGECAGGLLFPRQGVLPSPCAATISDGSVVSTQAAL